MSNPAHEQTLFGKNRFTYLMIASWMMISVFGDALWMKMNNSVQTGDYVQTNYCQADCDGK